MLESTEYGKPVYRPNPNEILTVRELIRILSECDPSAQIIVGTGLNDCEETVERVIVGKTTVLFATESNEQEE